MLHSLYRVTSPLVTPFRLLAEKPSPAEREYRLGRAEEHASGKPENILWLHGDNLGETKAVLKIVSLMHAKTHLLESFSMIKITSNTSHAVEYARDHLPTILGMVFKAGLVPFETQRAVENFLDGVSAGVLVETGVRPLLLAEARRRRIPVVLLDARLPRGQQLRWSLVSGLARSAYRSFAMVTAPTEGDARRVGSFREKPPVKPSLKFLSDPIPTREDETLRAAVAGRRVWLAASTHPPDDLIVLAAHAQVVQTYPDALLIIAPRYPKPIDVLIGHALTLFPRRVAVRSANRPVTGNTAVYIADTIGELSLFYSLADMALIGNSFSGQGEGHNFAEAAHAGVCVMHGPNFSAFDDLEDFVLAEVSGSVGPWGSPIVTACGMVEVTRYTCEAFSDMNGMRTMGERFRVTVERLGKAAEKHVVNVMTELVRSVRPTAGKTEGDT